jgi:hypothetical protein
MDVSSTLRHLTRSSAPPRPLDLYTTDIEGVYLCSAATPPGAGAHGMCGYNAATSALARCDRPPGTPIAPEWGASATAHDLVRPETLATSN